MARKKVSDEDAFVKGMRIGILVRRGIQLELDGKMQQFRGGDVIRPSNADLTDPEKNPFVAAVASRCRGSRTTGEPIGSQALAVFESEEALEAATELYRSHLVNGQKSTAWTRVEAELAKRVAQGRAVRSIAGLERLLETSVSEFHETVVSGIRAALIDELDLAPAAE